MGIGKAGINGVTPLDITSNRAIDITSTGIYKSKWSLFCGGI